MVIDLLAILGTDAPEYLKNILKSQARSELEICASASSTEEDKQAYETLSYCVRAEIKFDAASLVADIEIDTSKLTSTFLSKHSGLIDLVNVNLRNKGQFMLSNEVQNMFEWESTKERMIEYYKPLMENIIQSTMGGV